MYVYCVQIKAKDSLMKLTFPILLFFVCNSLSAQDYEEKIAELSCIYVQDIDIKEDIDKGMKKCILQAKFEVEQKHPELRPKASIEELREKYKNVFELLTKNCSTLTTKRSERKKYLTYVPSTNKEATFNLVKGDKLMTENKYSSAITAYRKAIRLDANFVMALDKLGIAYIKNDEQKKAIKTFKSSLKILPEGDVALFNLGEVYYDLEDNKDASVYFSTLTTYFPQMPKGYYGLAKTEFRDEINEAALLHSIMALKFFPETSKPEIQKANNIIDSIYSNMDKKNNLEAFNAIAKEHNFTYTSKK